ncbi:MAG: hypothetical protein U9R25_20055 [Chloroflexota bacterium]|nr:hypothetical protein [Chloroflexota bacterium]
MNSDSSFALLSGKPVHPWLRQLQVAYVPGSGDELSIAAVEGMLNEFQAQGHKLQSKPDRNTSLLLTTVPFGKVVNWRRCLTVTARVKYRLTQNPTIITVIHATEDQFSTLLAQLDEAIAKQPVDPADFQFPGLASTAWQVLLEQGQRGGPILALERVVQAQAKGIRVILVVGDERPRTAYHFDLVGAHPQSMADDPDRFYEDIVLRVVTSLSSLAINKHQVVGEPLSQKTWLELDTPAAMIAASSELGKRNFFTDTVHISDLVDVPAIGDTLASQYSEGCFATWDPRVNALVATVTGSARPVAKGGIGDDDLILIVGVREDGQGALVRNVKGKRNDPPSTEAVELYDLDNSLPRIALDESFVSEADVPVVRSKLHGHRGVASFDPRVVEYVPVSPTYQNYLVTCGTDTQAWAVRDAFAESQALLNPDDPRDVVFTILPGHGVIFAEKWVPGFNPFERILDYMDGGQIAIESLVPQGPVHYEADADGRMVLQDESLMVPVV